jgi:hypothetical protein
VKKALAFAKCADQELIKREFHVRLNFHQIVAVVATALFAARVLAAVVG